ncbi:DUF3458 domain-containing protein, partial [Klebsiella pneumoniae]
GTPTLKVSSTYHAASQTYELTVEQHTEPTHDQKEKQPLHIPLDIELYAPNGDVIALQCNGKPVSNVLDVKQAKQTFRFEQVKQPPIPSLLREFSAPVKLEYAYSDEELIFLMVHARNEFARWDAGQMLLAKYIRTNVERVQRGQPVELAESVID